MNPIDQPRVAADRPFLVHSVRRVRTADGRFLYEDVAPAVADAFGIARDVLLGEGGVDHGWIMAGDRAAFVEALEASAADLSPFDIEVRVALPGGGVRWIRSMGTPARRADGATVWEGVALDVTERHEAVERMNRAVAQARAAEASAVAHSHPPPPPSLAALSQALEAGNLEQARSALRELQATFVPAERPDQRDGLSRRQSEVALLISEGATNAEIALRLGISTGTVKLHVTAILKSLGLRSRVELARYVLQSADRR